MTKQQRQRVKEAVARCYVPLATYAARYARVADPHELLNQEVAALLESAAENFSSFTKIRSLEGLLKRRIRRRVGKLLEQQDLSREGRLVDGRTVRVGENKKSGNAEAVLTEIRLDDDNTGAHNALAEIAKVQDGSQPFLKALIRDETNAVLHNAIDVLPPKLKQYVQMRFFDRMSPKAIRKMTGASEKQVERWREDALEKLQGLLTEEV